MAYKIRYTLRALADLDGIYAFIAADKPKAAIAVKLRIQKSIESLAQFPALGRESDEAGARVLGVARHPFLIYYSFDEDAAEVAIIHIRHAARKR